MCVIRRVSNSSILVLFISGQYVVILVKKSNSVQSGIENFNFRPPSHSFIHPGAAAAQAIQTTLGKTIKSCKKYLRSKEKKRTDNSGPMFILCIKFYSGVKSKTNRLKKIGPYLRTFLANILLLFCSNYQNCLAVRSGKKKSQPKNW